MKIYAISDLHLSGQTDKPMNVFGAAWDNYEEKVKANWTKIVKDEDIVLLAGDLSWAMKVGDALLDLDFIHSLPGKKIIIKGNHDFWWQSIGKVRAILPSTIFAIQNDFIKIGNYIFCGTRGWTSPNGNDFSDDDMKIYLRETERLKLSLSAMQKVREEGDKVIALFHYPPFNVRREESNYTKLFEEYKVDKVIYGHLHGKDSLAILSQTKGGVTYQLTSCDLVDFTLQEVY